MGLFDWITGSSNPVNDAMATTSVPNQINAVTNKPKVPDSRQVAQGLVDQYKQNMTGPEDYTKQLMQGVPQAGQSVGFDPTSSALSARAKRSYQESTGGLQRQAELQGYQTGIEHLAKGQQLDITMNNVARGVQAQTLEAQLNADVTRNQILASTIGGIGQGIGGLAGIAKNAGMFKSSVPNNNLGPVNTFAGNTVPSENVGTFPGENLPVTTLAPD